MPIEKIAIGRDRPDLKEFGLSGTIFLGKHIVGEGEESHLTNPVQMDVIRPHIILICGKRGSGKCLDGDTLVTMEDGSQVPIKNLENDTRKVYGLDKTLKISALEKTEFFNRKANTMFRIRTRSGKEIKLTPEHPLLTIRGWVPANELKIGSRIATPRKLDFGTQGMEDCKIKLLAYLLAEGHIKKNMNRSLIRFTNMDGKIVKDFQESLDQFDTKLKMTLYRKGSYGIAKKIKTVDISGAKWDEKGNFAKGSISRPHRNSLIVWLESIGAYDKLSVDKVIPDEIFLLKKEDISLFLNRLFSCDGSIYRHKTTHGYVWQISYSSSSKILITQVHHLLLKFGIVSRIREKKIKLNGKQFESFEIVVNEENAAIFLKDIGFFGRKEERQEEYLKETKNSRNPNVDTIPREIWDVYRPKSWTDIGRKMGYSIPKGLRTSINYGPSRQKLLQIAMLDENPIIQVIANSDIFWDEIIMMEKTEGEFEVYDITVPEMHNFIANDIIVHNSYSGAVIAEEIALLPQEIRSNLSIILIDTMGIYWSMKQPNTRDANILKQWGLKPQGFQTRLFVPKGYIKAYEEAGVQADFPLTLPAGELTATDWMLAFGFSPIDDFGIALERIIKDVKQRNGNVYSVEDIIYSVQADKKSSPELKEALANRFLTAIEWGVFEKKGTPIKELVQPGISVIDVSHYMSISQSWSVKSMLVGLISRKLFQERLVSRKAEEFEEISGEKRKTVPMVWIVIDEAHEFLPSKGQTAASEALQTLIKQGREPGISLVMITQRPNRLHEDALAQADLIISHRLTAEADLKALRGIMQTYVLEDIQEYINTLPRQKGTAIILDDNSERIYSLQVRPRLSWHAGGSPAAIKKKGIFEKE